MRTSDVSDCAQRLRKRAWEKLRETKAAYSHAEECGDIIAMREGKLCEGILEILLDLIDEVEKETY